MRCILHMSSEKIINHKLLMDTNLFRIFLKSFKKEKVVFNTSVSNRRDRINSQAYQYILLKQVNRFTQI